MGAESCPGDNYIRQWPPTPPLGPPDGHFLASNGFHNLHSNGHMDFTKWACGFRHFVSYPKKKNPKNPAHQDLSKQHPKGTFFQFPMKFPATIQFKIFSEEIIQYSKAFAPQVQTNVMEPSPPCTSPTLLVKSFPKTPRTRSKASQFFDLITTKQNKTNQRLVCSLTTRASWAREHKTPFPSLVTHRQTK